MTPAQRNVIELVGRSLDLTPAHVTGIVASVAAAATPTPPAEGDAPPPL